MIEEVKKTIRDFPVRKSNPFKKSKGKSYLSKDKTFSVNIVQNGDYDSMNLTGIHKIDKEQALEIIGELLKERLGLTKGGINIFKYIHNNLEIEDGEPVMAFKVDFDHCCSEIGYTSTQSVWYGLAELLDKGIIARSGAPGVYFLNPVFFQTTSSFVVTEYYKLKN